MVKISEKNLRVIGRNGFGDKRQLLLTLNVLNGFENITLLNKV